MSVDVRGLLEKIKLSSYYEVEVDMPDGFSLRGRAPFAVSIKGSQATFRVLAPDENLAHERVYEYLNQQDEASGQP